MDEQKDDFSQNEDSEELFEHYNYIADPGQEKLRIDKFLIDRKGFPVARFSSEIEPDSPLLIKKLEEELEK